MASSTSNPRASLLAGLRTGGVRSASQPFAAPHSTAPLNGQFNIPRAVSSVHPSFSFPDEEDEIDQLTEMTSQFTFDPYNDHQAPMTASAIESNFLLQQQLQQQQHRQMLLNQLAAQRAGLAENVHNANGQQMDIRAQMQMELLKYQVMQQQSQYQADFAAQAQAQVQRQMQATQSNYSRNLEPMTAAPSITSFDHRANAIAQLRARQLERLSIPLNDEFISTPISGPMTASIDGKFGSRALNPHAASFMSRFGDQDGSLLSPLPNQQHPPTPSRTTVISGGTSLGSLALASPMTPSKSDAAVSWRRGVASPATPSRASPNTGSVLRSLRGISEETGKSRPQPLNLHQDNFGVTSHIQSDAVNEDDPASGSSKTGSPTSTSTPATPPPVQPVLSAEPKKSYENLGVGRPTAVNVVNTPRFVSLPSRQPKGPPSGADELGPRNFASRIRRQAIGGLGVLVNAREQRELAVEVQAY